MHVFLMMQSPRNTRHGEKPAGSADVSAPVQRDLGSDGNQSLSRQGAAARLDQRAWSIGPVAGDGLGFFATVRYSRTRCRQTYALGGGVQPRRHLPERTALTFCAL